MTGVQRQPGKAWCPPEADRTLCGARPALLAVAPFLPAVIQTPRSGWMGAVRPDVLDRVPNPLCGWLECLDRATGFLWGKGESLLFDSVRPPLGGSKTRSEVVRIASRFFDRGIPIHGKIAMVEFA